MKIEKKISKPYFEIKFGEQNTKLGKRKTELEKQKTKPRKRKMESSTKCLRKELKMLPVFKSINSYLEIIYYLLIFTHNYILFKNAS